VLLKRRRDGDYDLKLGTVERQILVALCADLRAALGDDAPGQPGDEPTFRRLFPTAYLNEPDLERSYQAMVGDELVATRVRALETVERTCEEGRLARHDLDLWLTAINALRLVLGTRLDVGEQHDVDDIDDDDPDLHAHAIYDFLTAMLAMVLMEVAADTGWDPAG
jgi:hypothetical protein